MFLESVPFIDSVDLLLKFYFLVKQIETVGLLLMSVFSFLILTLSWAV